MLSQMHSVSTSQINRLNTGETFTLAEDSQGYKAPKRHWILFVIFSILSLILGCVLIGMNLDFANDYYYSCDSGMCYNVSMTLGTCCLLAILLLYLNATNSFESTTNKLYAGCNGKFRVYILAAFLFLAISDVVLLAISEACEAEAEANDECVQPIIDPDSHIFGSVEFRWITRTITAMCGLLMFTLILTYWNLIAYYCSNNTWIHSLLYMTIIGYIVVSIARWLRPPPPAHKMKSDPFIWSWHANHDPWKLIKYMMIFLFLCVFVFIGLGTLLLVAFAEASKSSENLGLSWWGPVLLYSFLALLMGITPLAPSTPVDACGGFLLTGVFYNTGMTVYEAWALTLGIVIVLHFIGSCLQYYLGKVPFIQFWANQWLPPDLLAASDSVLRYANFFKVGMVGQVFMDTSNGLNQGRMNMNFCTQFWSEYASIPSAIGWVTTGAVLAISTFETTSSSDDTTDTSAASNKYEWASQAIVICIMISTLWQSIASTLGASALAQSATKESFWTNREKWVTTQHFYKNGVMVTKTGWENDVFQLKKLFEKVEPIHNEYVKVSSTAETGVDERIYAKRYQLLLERVRREHYKMLGINYKTCERVYPTELVSTNELYDTSNKNINFWTSEPHSKWKMACLILFVIFGILTGLYAYYGIANSISTTVAVRDGVSALDFSSDNLYSWFALFVFCIIYVIYGFVEIIDTFKQSVSMIKYVFKCGCCTSIDKTWETVYDIKHIEWKRQAKDDNNSNDNNSKKRKNKNKKANSSNELLVLNPNGHSNTEHSANSQPSTKDNRDNNNNNTENYNRMATLEVNNANNYFNTNKHSAQSTADSLRMHSEYNQDEFGIASSPHSMGGIYGGSPMMSGVNAGVGASSFGNLGGAVELTSKKSQVQVYSPNRNKNRNMSQSVSAQLANNNNNGNNSVPGSPQSGPIGPPGAYDPDAAIQAGSSYANVENAPVIVAAGESVVSIPQ